MNDIIIVGEYNLVTQYQLDNLMLLEKEIRMTPFIKWAGGKRQLLGRINELLPNSFNNYYEPFIGGGAVLFNIRPTNSFINDINKALINTYIQIRDNHIELINLLKVLDKKVALYQKEFYYEARIEYNKLLKNNIYSVETAAYFIFLNKHGFNGLYRVNKKGEFNVPYNNSTRPSADYDIFEGISDFLKGINIICGDFEPACENVKENDFVFFDSPYAPVKSDSFEAYTKEGFSKENHERLASLYRKLDRNGVKCMLTNHNTELINQLYDGFEITVVPVKRMINCDATNRVGEEVIVTNY